MADKNNQEIVIETDVLVIGGGIAACFAAVKAREQGVDVTLVSKGVIGRSGMSPWAHGTMAVPPEKKDKIRELADQAHVGGEYLNNCTWTERVIRESYARFQDMLAWGQPFLKDEKGDYIKPMSGNQEQEGRLWALEDGPGSWAKSLRNQPVKMGVRILEKVMIVDLIKQDGAVVGAVGITRNSFDLYVIRAKATVMCAGSGGFKPVGGWPLGDLTSDGHVMAYRAGAEITGKEFEDFHNGMVRRQGGIWLSNILPMTNAEGDSVPGFGFGLSADIEAHEGRAPLYRGEDEVFSGVALGLSVHTAEGVWPVDEDCSTGVSGLYVAGDSCATMIVGAAYSMGGSGSCNASVTGARAGLAAAGYSRQKVLPSINWEEFSELKDSVIMPARRKGGFSPNWVTQLLKNAMMPYYILRIKHADRLQPTLAFVEFMRDHLCPRLFARDPHELRLVHETKNMIINAEMKMRASLFRTESRGTHYREDYPLRSDPDWLAWVMIRQVNGKMTVYKKPIPQEWRPDLTAPYEERYPAAV
ncbi:MAG: FAD-binding protein [Deltaproteobacteria bacterium]|nr:FAD-binding protein [Deltaproteobacteria bacterium]